ncbi:MAG TPA: FtsQ-type POTRA domain-containing protein [Gemmatimonadales bacterium]
MTVTAMRRWAAAGIVAIVVVAIAVFAPRAIRRLRFFQVRSVEVVGARYLDPVDVARRLGVRHTTSMFDPLAPMERAATAIPGVIRARVTRRFPGTLRVTVDESSPVALVTQGDHLALMDARGRVLPFDPVRLPASLPIADRDSLTAALLDRLRRADPDGYDAAESARRDHGDVVVQQGARTVRYRPGADDDMLRAVIGVRSYLTQHGLAWREIDARYQSRIFVRTGAT